MKWNVSIGIKLTIDYDDIEADTEEEAEQIARERALEDIDFNNAELDEYGGITVYCAYPNEDKELYMNVDRCAICGSIIPEGRQVCWACEVATNEKNT